MQLIYGDDKQAYRLDRLLIVVNDRQDQLQVQVAGQLNKRKLAINGNVSLLNAENAVLVFSSDSVAEFISAGETKAKFKGQASLGKTKLNSELLLFFTQGKPEIKGEIISSGLFLHDLGIFPASTVPVKQQDKLAKPRLLFSYDPIPLQGFDNLNLDLKLKISRLTAENYKLNNLVIHLLLRDKRLSLAPVSFNFSGERVQFTATIELRAKPIWTLSIVANNIPLDKLLGQKNTAHRGKVSVETKLKGVGQSMHEIASSLKGDFSVVLENETISRSELELVFLNPMGWIFSQGIFSNEILISCGLAQYSIKQGIAKSTLLLIDGPKLFLRGNEEVNLGKETINAYYNLQKKNIFENTLFLDSFNTHVPIKVSGNIIDPVVEQAPLESLESKASRYVFAPVATIPREVIATVLDIFEDNREEAQSPCKEFLQH